MPVKKPLNQLQIAPFVRELRVLTGLTQEQFAAALGVTFSSVSRWVHRAWYSFTSSYAED